MALYKWKCKFCGSRRRALLTGEPLGNPNCTFCSTSENAVLMERESGGSTSVLESLDNGAMVRKVERFRDIEELRTDHASLTKKDDDGIV